MTRAALALLVGTEEQQWRDVTKRLAEDGFAVEAFSGGEDPNEIAARAQQDGAIIIVDISTDLLQRLAIVSACRRQASATPVIVVADRLSPKLADSILAAGAFRVVVHPLSAVTMSQMAFAALGSLKRQPSRSPVKRKVLLVDDDADFCSAVTTLLESKGDTVRCASSGKQGLQQVLTEQPDLVVLDIMLEDAWAGQTVNQAMKCGARHGLVRGIPILMVSSSPAQPAVRFGRTGQVEMMLPNAYMTKPLDNRAFLDRVEEMLARVRRAPEST